MAIRTTRFHGSFNSLLSQFHSLRSLSTLHKSLENRIKDAIESKTYNQIPNLLLSSTPQQSSNPFSFLSAHDHNLRIKITTAILTSLLSYRPRTDLKCIYTSLLSHSLQYPNPLPISLAVLQHTLRSGISPDQQTRLHVASAWLDRRRRGDSVADILLEMESVGCDPDSCTCNYVMSSLVCVDRLQESVDVLKGMVLAKCVPDSEGYGVCIGGLCRARRTEPALGLLKEMVVEMGLTPRQGIVVKLAAALRANREAWKVVGMVEFLEREDCVVGFEGYHLVLQCCLECRESVLAGKVAVWMVDKGYLPYIKTRQKVVEGLADSGEWKLASAVRQRFAEVGS